MAKLDIIPIREAISSEIRYIEGRREGTIKSLATPWESWNDLYMDGFEYGWIITIAGLSGSGKTAIANYLETQLFDCNPGEDFEVLNFNFEMLARRLIGRKISSKLEIKVKDLYSTSGNVVDNNLLEEIKQEIAPTLLDYKINYVEVPGTTDDLRDTILYFIEEKRLRQRKAGLVVFLDHTLLVKKAANRQERDTLNDIALLVNELKKIYPKSIFIILSQLNREIEKSERKAAFGSARALHFPQKGDIFGSEFLFQVSDGVIIPHRPELLNLDSYGPKKAPVGDRIYCHHLKVRDGVMQSITAFKNHLDVNILVDYLIPEDERPI